MKNTKIAIKAAADQVGEHVKETKKEDYQGLAQNAFKGNISIKTLAGISDEKEESVYGQAYLLYNTGRYKEATEVFRVLITINATEPKYMMGLAACFHMMKDYDSAVASYMICTFLDPFSPIPHFHLSDCYIQLEDKLSAIASLEAAIKRADKPEFKTLKERCEITLNGLKAEQARDSDKK